MTEDLTGKLLGGFQVLSLLGEGAHGSVWRARQLRLDRDVALKVLDPVIARNAETVRRFEREGRAAASLDHPNIVPVFEAGEADGLVFLAMRLVDGSTLDEQIAAGGPLARRAAVEILSPVAEALDHVHSRGLVHRDVKPSNILIDGDHVWLTDFGIASSLRELGNYTTGALGTAEYMAPEQANAATVDSRADVYGLGCVAHYVMEGRPPYERSDLITTLMAHVNDPIPAVGDPHRDGFYSRALAKDPADRFQSASELVGALADSNAIEPIAAAGARPPARKNLWFVAVALAIAVAVAAGLAVSGGSDGDPPAASTSAPSTPAASTPATTTLVDDGIDGEASVPATTAALVTGGSAEVGTIRRLDGLNPHVDLEMESFITANVLPPLMVVNDDWTLSPWLAAAEPVVRSGDPLIVRWTLRDDAVWDDGSAVTSTDVARTLDYITDAEAGAQATGLYFGLSIDIVDDHMFDMVFANPIGPYRILFSTLHPVIKAAAYDHHLAAGNSPATFLGEEIGFSGGPYRVSGFDPGERITVVRNERWWGEPALLDRVTIRSFDRAEDQLKAVESGDVDLIYVESADATDVLKASAFDGVEVATGAGFPTVQLHMNTRIGATSELAVRTAIAEAIDRSAITATAVTPITGELAAPDQSLIWPAKHPANARPFERYQGDTGAAQELLQAAGWQLDALGNRSRDGETLELQFVYNSELSLLGQVIAQNVILQLDAAGIRVVATALDDSTITGRVVRGEYDLAVAVGIASPDPVSALLNWGSAYCPAEFAVPGCDSALAGNTTGIADDSLDALLTAAHSSTDPGEREQLYVQADARLAELVPALPLFEEPMFVAHSDALGGIDIDTQRSGPFAAMSRWGFLS